MRKLLMTTAIMFPLVAAPAAFAQETTTEPEAETETLPAEGAETTEEAVEDAGQAVEEGAEEVGQAVEEGAEETGQVLEEGAEETGQAVEQGAEEAEQAAEEGAEQAVTGDAEAIVREQAANELRLDWITGTTLQSPDGENIGDISDLILDGETGQIQAVIVGVGGFLGIGQKQIAVAWDQLQINYDANEITSDLTEEEAEAAPEYVFRDQEQPPAPAGTAPATGTAPVEDTGAMGGGTAPATETAPTE